MTTMIMMTMTTIAMMVVMTIMMVMMVAPTVYSKSLSADHHIRKSLHPTSICLAYHTLSSHCLSCSNKNVATTVQGTPNQSNLF